MCNHTQHNITLDNFTVLGSFQSIDKIVETDQTDSIEVNNANSPISVVMDDKDKTEQLFQLWHPPVDVSHLNDEQQAGLCLQKGRELETVH